MRTNQASISIYLEKAELQEIEKASKIVSLNLSSFCRTIALQKAREINKEGDKLAKSD